MNKIDRQLKKIQTEKRMGLMTHTVLGYPSVDESIRIVKAMVKAGADFIELQIPFSDPVADGPTLMRANKKALENGMTTEQAMQIMAGLNKVVDIPLLFMTYFNIVLQYGVEKFCKNASKFGCSGLIIPDIPLDEEQTEHFIEISEKYGLVPVRLLSPASTEGRIKKNAKIAQNGFVYFVSKKGTTGASIELGLDLKENIDKLKKYFNIPIAVGFGISKPEHIHALKGIADIVVVGSEVTNVYDSAEQGQKIIYVKNFIKSLTQAVKKD